MSTPFALGTSACYLEPLLVVLNLATGINYGAAATDWESMDSEAMFRPDRKDKSIGSESGRVPVVDQPAVLPQEPALTVISLYRHYRGEEEEKTLSFRLY